MNLSPSVASALTLCNPKTTNFEANGFSFGSLRREDVLAVMSRAFIREEPEILAGMELMVMYAIGDGRESATKGVVMKTLYRQFHPEFMTLKRLPKGFISKQGGLNTLGISFLYSLFQLSIDIFLLPAGISACDHCERTGFVQVNGAKKTCAHCHGTGREVNRKRMPRSKAWDILLTKYRTLTGVGASQFVDMGLTDWWWRKHGHDFLVACVDWADMVSTQAGWVLGEELRLEKQS